MVSFRVTPYPSEAQVLQGQSQARVLYSIGAEASSEAQGAGVPVYLGIILDRSGSMQGDKLAAAKDALINLLREVPDTDSVVVHITLFSEGAQQLFLPLTGREISRDLPEITRRILRIKAHSGTDLSSGLRVALRAARPYAEYERRILIITDGQHSSSVPLADVYAVTRRLSRAGIRLDAWGVGYGWDVDQLLKMTRTTDGEANVIPDARSLVEAIARLFHHVQRALASNVRLVLHTPIGTRIASVRQVYPSVQDRVAQQASEQKWVVPVGALLEATPGEEARFVIELETTPRASDIPFRILVPEVLYNIGSDELCGAPDRTSWLFVRWVMTPAEIQINSELAHFTGEEEIVRLAEEGFALLKTGAAEEASLKLNSALQLAMQIKSPQAATLSTMIDPTTGKLVSANANDAINKTGRLNVGKTGKLTQL